MPSSRGSSRLKDQTCVSYVSCFGRRVLYHQHYLGNSFKECSVQLISRIRLPLTPWTAACQASLSITKSWSLLKLLSIVLVMPSNHLILCHPLLLLPSIFPSIRDFSSELVLHIRWPKYWSFSFSISPSNEHSGLIFFRIGWLDLLAVPQTARRFSQSILKKINPECSLEGLMLKLKLQYFGHLM